MSMVKLMVLAQDSSFFAHERRDRIRLRECDKGHDPKCGQRCHAALFHCSVDQSAGSLKADVYRVFAIEKTGRSGTFIRTQIQGFGAGWRDDWSGP